MAVPISVILQDWANLGIFDYVLPFLLIFALVFAILHKIKITGDDESSRWINAIVALAVGLMALQFDYVSTFFAVLFPRVGIGVGILLLALIMLGLFVDYKSFRGQAYIFMIIGGVVGAVILLNSLQDFSWWTGSFWLTRENTSAIVAGVILIIFVFLIVNSAKDKSAEGTMWTPIKAGGKSP
ncbi:hypothetical protein HYW74_04940 [Candidatus Pacearchaeota archaeon]|nr:hypothetical protein [Candidatus Pacearchaeota archaeon]